MNKFVHGLVTALILGTCICLKVYGQTLYPGESATVYCMPFPLPTPKPTPAPVPVPVPAPTHSALQTVELACSMYGQGKRSAADATRLNLADKTGKNCTIVLTWWETDVAGTWCPYFRNYQNVKFCGPYDDWTYIHTEDGGNLGGDIYNNIILPLHPGWVYPGSKNMYDQAGSQTVFNHGDLATTDFYMDYFKQVPASIYNGKWSGTYQQRNWNLRFLDDYLVDGSQYFVNGPIKSRDQWEAEALTAIKRLRQRADAAGNIALFANIWSDVEREYWNRQVYRDIMDYLDYGLFETWTYTMDGKPETEAVWLRRIKTAQDMVKNHRAAPVVNTEIGNYWYALSSLLLVRENGRGLAWSQKLPPDDVLEKVRGLDLGMPLEDYQKRSGVYQREWTKGKVVVNPSDSVSYFISLEDSYKDLETGKSVQGITLAPKTGKIFVKQ